MEIARKFFEVKGQGYQRHFCVRGVRYDGVAVVEAHFLYFYTALIGFGCLFMPFAGESWTQAVFSPVGGTGVDSVIRLDKIQTTVSLSDIWESCLRVTGNVAA